MKWKNSEKSILQERFSSTTNRSLAQMLSRSERSVAQKASRMGLRKDKEHRSALSREIGRKYSPPERMAMIAPLGGKIGGPARAAALSPEQRKQIARQAAITRWEKYRMEERKHERENNK